MHLQCRYIHPHSSCFSEYAFSMHLQHINTPTFYTCSSMAVNFPCVTVPSTTSVALTTDTCPPALPVSLRYVRAVGGEQLTETARPLSPPSPTGQASFTFSPVLPGTAEGIGLVYHYYHPQTQYCSVQVFNSFLTPCCDNIILCQCKFCHITSCIMYMHVQ